MNNVSNLYCDASFSHVTKKAGWCANLVHKDLEGNQKAILFYASLDAKFETNNCAEALAVLKALSVVLHSNLKFTRLNIHLDSFYAIHVLYKYFHSLFYFCSYMRLPRRLKYSPKLVNFPIEENHLEFILKVRNKFQSKHFDVGVFYVKSHTERHPNVLYNYHQINNNQVDKYAYLARIALEQGNPVKLQVIRAP